MDLKFVLVWILSFQLNSGETPLSSCSNYINPYKTMNNSCSNFNDVCVKKGDKECETFQNVCKQCPSSNLTILMYRDMINMKDQITSMKSHITEKGNNFNISYILVGLSSFILLLLALLVILYICFEKGKVKEKSKVKEYSLVSLQDSEKNPNQENKIYSEMIPSLEIIEGKIMTMEDSLKESLQKSNSNMKEIDEKIIKMAKSLKESFQISLNLRNNMTFNISGASRPVELFIGPKENVLQVKRQICSHWPAAKPGDYKIMIIKYKCQPLNDHNNFMSYNIPTNATLDCELDTKLDPKDFLILKLQGNEDLPQLMKISKELTISDLKTFIKCFLNITSSPIIREMKTGQEFDNKMVLTNNKLQDNDWIDVITETRIKLTVKSLFNESETCNFEFSNIDMILDIKKRIKSQLNLKSENIILFWNNLLLENDKYIQDYNVNDEFPIKFCYLDMLDGVTLKSRNIIKNDFYTLTKGCYSENEIFNQKYKLKENVLIIKSSNFKNQLINYQIINSHHRFMSIHAIFLDKTDLYVFLENNVDEVIVEVIKESTLSEKEIAKWSIQILEGLKKLHDNNIVHKNLKPTSIYVNRDGNIKLSCFNMIGNLNNDEFLHIDSELIINYWSPEVLRSQQFSIKSDVWSFGAVIYYLITKKPFPKLDENYSYSKTEYSNLGVSEELQDFLNQCLIEDQNERPDVEILLQHPFLEKKY